MGVFDFLKKNNYIIEHPERYAEEEIEVFALTKDRACASRVAGDKYWSAHVGLLGCVDTRTGRMLNDYTVLTWDLSEAEHAAKGRKYGLKEETIYLLRVRPARGHTDKSGREIPAGHGLFVTGVVKRNCANSQLSKILEDFRRPRSVTLSDGTVLTYERRMDWYSGTVSWMGEQCDVMLSADEGTRECAPEALSAFERIYAAQAEWDKKAREYAAKELTELANDWRQDDDDHVITRAEFARRIGTPCVTVDDEGGFQFMYSDDDMFWGHTVAVFGSIEEGFSEAIIEG